MDNSQLVFCKVEDIEKKNEEECVEEIVEELLEELLPMEDCDYCLGMGYVECDNEEYDCEYCDIYEISCSEDSDPDYEPNWSSDCDSDSGSDMDIDSDCGDACNDRICVCGSV